MVEISQSVVQVEVIHPCALINAGMHVNVRGWNAEACARLISAAAFDKARIVSLLLIIAHF